LTLEEEEDNEEIDWIDMLQYDAMKLFFYRPYHWHEKALIIKLIMVLS
jgi:hypothetical protein